MSLRRIAPYALISVLAIWLVAAGCGGGGTGGREIVIDGPVQMTRSFDEGASFKYSFKMQSEVAVAMQGFDRVASTQTEFRTSNEVVSVGAEDVQISMRFDHAVSSIAMEDNVIPNESVVELRGKELLFTLTPDGDVLSWAGLSGSGYLEEGAGETGLLLYGLFPELPEGSVEVGYTWEDEIDIPDITSSVDRDFIGDITYTVTGFKEKYGISCVEVATSTTFIFEGKAEQEGSVWLMSGEGTSEGTILISLEDGMVLYGVSDTMMDLEGEGSSVGGAAASSTVSMGVKTHTQMELL